MKGASFLCIFALLFAAQTQAQNPIEELLKAIINDILSGLEDPQPVNDTTIEWIGNQILLTATTDAIEIVGTSLIQVADLSVDLLGNFEVDFEVPVVVAQGGLDFFLDSTLVWDGPVFGNGPVWGELQTIHVTIKGQLIIVGPEVRNFDYTLSLGKVTVEMDSLQDGGPDAAEIIAHVNANGPEIINNVDAANHEHFRTLLQDAINKYLSGERKHKAIRRH